MSAERRTGRGNTLLFTMILLAVLSVIGVAAVSLSARERDNASSVRKWDKVQACARAAQAKIYAELATYGSGYLSSNFAASELVLPDGTELAVGHIPDMPQVRAGTITVQSVVLSIAGGAGGEAPPSHSNLSNAIISGNQRGTIQRVAATCVDHSGSQPRTFEVELGLRLAL